MNVVHSCTSESFSGLEQYVLDLVDWQNRNNLNVTLFCREGTELQKHAQERDIRVWKIPQASSPGPRLWYQMYRRWNDFKHATLHMHAGGEPKYHLPWLSNAHVRSILHYHIWIDHKKRDPLHRLLFSQIDEVWTSSESARHNLSNLLPVDYEKIRVVQYGRQAKTLSNGPKSQWRKSGRDRLAIPSDAILGVCIARIEPIKGISELFDAFIEIALDRPKAHLAIVGNASPNNQEAKNFERDLREHHKNLPDNLRTRLHLPGYLNQPEEILCAADFYVLPSYEESMSLAMLDALILGLPIIGTQSGGTPSVVRPGETGILVPPKNSKLLAQALECFYDDEHSRTILSTGAQRLGQTFEREEIFQNIVSWYNA